MAALLNVWSAWCYAVDDGLLYPSNAVLWLISHKQGLLGVHCVICLDDAYSSQIGEHCVSVVDKSMCT